jgi:N-ethylmaleimide reductase
LNVPSISRRSRQARVDDVESGLADVITVGTQALANPDLVARIRSKARLNEAHRSTFYGGDERGYIDYPTLEDVMSSAH